MALLFIEGWDHYTNTAHKWQQAQPDTPSFVSGRFGTGQAFNPGGTNKAIKLLNDVGGYYTTLIGGCAFYGISSQGYPIRPVFGFMVDGVEQCWVAFTSSFRFAVYRQGTILAEETTVRGLSTWNYVELKVTLATGATGSFELRVNGATVLSYVANIQTAVSNIYANQIAVGNGVQGSYNGAGYRDDLYVCDTSGSAPTNDFLGDIRVETIYPNANGSSSMLVGSDGNSTDNYLLVDEHPPDDDTTYVASANVNDKDTYNYDSLVSTTGTIYGIQTNMRAKKSDAGARSIAPVVKSGANESVGASTALTTTYANLREQVFEAKPGGGVWTIADVNAAEFGVKVTA